MVQIGATNGDYTEILSGLSEGQSIIYRGYEALNENDPVVPARWGQEGPAELPPARGEETIAGAQYACPMHPEVVQDKPGVCSKCGMKLVPKNVVYTCPMHPEVKEKQPGLCPKCQMKLQPAVVDETGKPKSASGATGTTGQQVKPAPQARTGKYYCPMHPEVTSNDPNATCPKCGGMKLVPRPAAQGPANNAVYWCPMHPEVTSSDPNATCPKCDGMKLQPKPGA